MKRSRNRRGATLIEGMVAAVIFAIAITGTIPALLAASRQNIVAAKYTHAGALASQVRAAMQDRGRTWLVGVAGPLVSAACTANADVIAAAGPAGTIPGACVVDLDAYETSASATNKLVPGYSAEDTKLYRRLAVRVADTAVPPAVDTVIVVVSFRDALGRKFVERPMALYLVNTNKAKVEL